MAGKSIIGAYGKWAAGLRPEPPLLSLRRDEFRSVSAWRRKAMAKALEFIAPPQSQAADVRVGRRFEFDGLAMEEVSWQLPYGPRTDGIFMKPEGAEGRLPAVLALHDHGGFKYMGWQKIARTSADPHPLIVEHQADAYEGVGWANELARRGYAVLAHDAYAFGSRRVRYEDLSEGVAADLRDTGSQEDIRAYNTFASAHESVMAKSLFCAGTTWPGVTLSEDQRALDYLLSRDDVDADRTACCGLSGGGLRTAYLAGLDHRLKAAVCVGFMSTWNDFLLNKAWTHTWMTYAPLLSNYLDFPEIFALRAPLPSLVQSCTEDPLYTVPEMKRADEMLKRVFEKAGSSENYRTAFYPGGHKFDLEMQKEAFDWLDPSWCSRLRIPKDGKTWGQAQIADTSRQFTSVPVFPLALARQGFRARRSPTS